MKGARREERTARIKQALESLAFVSAKERPFIELSGKLNETGWIFDLRNILLRAPVLDDVAALFWSEFGSRKIQLGTVETAGISLLAGILAHGKAYTRQETTGFYIRKSRKKTGHLRMVEGDIEQGKEIVLVDDVINSGRSFMRQVEVVESLGHTVSAIWTFIRYRDESYYEYFRKKGIAVRALFELNDFRESLGIRNVSTDAPPRSPRQAFTVLWKFASPAPAHQHVVAKSDPVIDGERVYVGSDSGTFWAINQTDGSVAWSNRVGPHPKGKGIFSSPAIYNGVVYFGAYDGNVYALDAKTGKKKWISFEGDWIGSSPALAPELGMLFIGLEFGLWKKHGGIAALDMRTGKHTWSYLDMPAYTHSSPLYIHEQRQVVIGSNDGAAYLFDAKNGQLVWKFGTGIPTDTELERGFSRFDIKESFAYDARHDLIIFGNVAGELFFVDRQSGAECARFKAEAGFYSTPLVYKNSVIVTSLDKHTYCVDLDSFRMLWKWDVEGRIFASPVLIEGSVYIGANTGRLTELDPDTGEERSVFLVAERITNKVAYNSSTRKFFLPTFANEIYCIAKARPE